MTWWNPIRTRRERHESQDHQAWLERNAERTHQQALLNSFLHSLETIQESATQQREVDSQALIAVAKGMVAQAESFQTWINSFQTATQPSTSTIREEDEYAEEQQRLVAKGFPADITSLPEEWRLAYALRNDPNLAIMNEP